MTKETIEMMTNLEQRVFNIQNESMLHGAWWWWFWLFFFNNPKNPAKPRQLMILWSTKNGNEIDCNNLKIKLCDSHDRSKLHGAVASWYFDGEKMHHNFLLEQCDINVTDKELFTDSSTPTSFVVNKGKNIVRIGNDFEFIAEAGNNNVFAMPNYRSHTYLGNKGYSLMRLNHLNLSGKVNNMPIHGSAYFQRVFINASTPSWYWGIFHFERDGILTYFNPNLFGKSIKKDVSFFDGREMHRFTDINVKKIGKHLPTFSVSSENYNEKLKFTVNPYSHSSWTFRKKVLGLIPNKLVYNEYPAVISDIELENNKTGKKIVLGDLGKSVGNAEHTTGFLL
ncbi:MAG: hypothetical protein KAR20_22620 [Candidatus Heimdallarchaeota archaeon]|nr:hypothetical protein [Candidatus Heimdallarchaeota archaeon]